MVQITGARTTFLLGVNNHQLRKLIHDEAIRPRGKGREVGDMRFELSEVEVLRAKLDKEREERKKGGFIGVAKPPVKEEPKKAESPVKPPWPSLAEKEKIVIKAPPGLDDLFPKKVLNSAEAAEFLGVTSSALSGILFRTNNSKSYQKKIKYTKDGDGYYTFLLSDLEAYKEKFKDELHGSNHGTRGSASKGQKKEPQKTKGKNSITRAAACEVLGVTDAGLQVLLNSKKLKSLYEDDVLEYMESVERVTPSTPKPEEKKEPVMQLKDQAVPAPQPTTTPAVPAPPLTAQHTGPMEVGMGRIKLTQTLVFDAVTMKQLNRVFGGLPDGKITNASAQKLEVLESIFEGGASTNPYTQLLAYIRSGATLVLEK